MLKQRRQREYTRHGRSEKYLEIKNIFEEKLKSEMVKYMEKIMLEVTEGKRGSSYPALKKLGARPGEGSKSWFQLPSHVDRNLSPAQSAEVIAEHFTSISQELSPFDISRLPPNTQAYLLTQDQMLAPELSTQDVFKRITKAK